ncbi:MAG: flagellar export chaperone FlgN [Rhodothermaceae bacterium]
MNIKKLIEILEKEIHVLQEMRDIAYAKQSALINRNREEIEECIKLEENNIALVKQTELSRINTLEEIYKSEDTEMNDHKLIAFIKNFGQKLEPKIVKYIEEAENQIKILVRKIADLNRNNLFLIKHSLQFIDSTIATLLGNKERKILDRRI